MRLVRRSGAVGLIGVALRQVREEYLKLAGGPGFEPRLTGSEPVVLPLNYPPKNLGQGVHLAMAGFIGKAHPQHYPVRLREGTIGRR